MVTPTGQCRGVWDARDKRSGLRVQSVRAQVGAPINQNAAGVSEVQQPILEQAQGA